MSRWPLVRLAAVCDINPKQNGAERLRPDALVSFVPMAAVDEVTGRISGEETRPLDTVTKGYTPFRDNDVLFAKITPCMENGKAAIAHGLKNGVGFGSTEFHVLRPKVGLLPKWVFAFVRQPAFRDVAKANFTGTAGQQRVPADFLKQTQIPVPPLAEQERIVRILDEAEALRRLRAQAIGRTADVAVAFFDQLFGNPLRNLPGWPQAQLCDLGNVVTGTTPPSAMKGMFRGDIPFVTPGDLERDTTATARFVTEAGALQSRTVRAGSTFVCCIGATIGKTDRSWVRSAFNQQINAIEWNDSVDDDYGWMCMRLMKPLIVRQGGLTALPILKKSLFERIQIPVPPIELQHVFAARVAEIRELETAQAVSRQRLDDLFQSLLHRAFQGEL